jgi:hypothetical protein
VLSMSPRPVCEDAAMHLLLLGPCLSPSEDQDLPPQSGP